MERPNQSGDGTPFAEMPLRPLASARPRAGFWHVLIWSGVALICLAVVAAGVALLVLALFFNALAPRAAPEPAEPHLPPVLRKSVLTEVDVPEVVAILVEEEPGGTTESARYRKANALELITTLGPVAKGTLPAVVRLVRFKGGNGNDSDLRHRAAWTLNRLVHHDVEGVLPALLEVLPDADGHLHPTLHSILGAIGKYGPRAKAAVPELVKLLNRSKIEEHQIECLACLAKIGPEAKEAIPAVASLLDSRERDVADVARSTLKKIDPTGGW